MTNDLPPFEEDFTPVSSIGEFGLIDRMKQVIAPGSEYVVTGIGDDAAAFKATDGTLQLITTDALIEHVHFDRTYSPMIHLGYKAISVNVSDIAAMNGTPRFATVALGLPNSVSVEMVDALYEGMRQAAAFFDLSIIGGDTTASHKLVLAVTVLGDCPPDRLTRRSGASPGDLICVTGTLGASFAGLRILQYHKQRLLEMDEGYEPDLSPFAPVLERHLRPVARTDVVGDLGDAELIPSAMIDLSDGLASDIRHLCKASGCGAEIDSDEVPVLEETAAVAALMEESADTYAFRGGEDYELLFAVDPSRRNDVEEVADVSIVGVCLPPEEGLVVRKGNHREPLNELGFTHF